MQPRLLWIVLLFSLFFPLERQLRLVTEEMSFLKTLQLILFNLMENLTVMASLLRAFNLQKQLQPRLGAEGMNVCPLPRVGET